MEYLPYSYGKLLNDIVCDSDLVVVVSIRNAARVCEYKLRIFQNTLMQGSGLDLLSRALMLTLERLT